MLALGVVLLAGVLGVAVSVFGGGMVLLALAAALPLPIIFKDYRAGVLLLTFLLPASSMLPHIRGLNVLNFATIATLASFMLHATFSKAGTVRLPQPLIWCFGLPATVAIVIAWPHIPEGIRNYPMLADARSIYDPSAYAISRYVKPIFYYFSYVFLLANAVRSSKRPELFLAALGASVLVPTLAVFYTVASYPGSLSDVARDREFLSVRGMHANEFGMLLALPTGPLLFLVGGARTRAWRWMALAVLGLVTIALLLTFSRGGLAAFVIVVAGFLLHHKRVKTFLAIVAAAALLLMAAPAAMQERFGTGFRSGALSDASVVEKDDLTAGRVHGWMLLAPEVLQSPWLGRGLGSTQWSSAVATGRYQADHPHNIYLEILMDFGLFGFAAMVYLHYRYLRRFRQLGTDSALSDELRSFFLGARYSLWGILAMAATTNYYMPYGAQFYLWFSLGLLFAYWQVPSPAPAASAARKWVTQVQRGS